MLVLLLVGQTFGVVGGEVGYWTVARSAAGLVPHEIRAVNRDVSGTVRVLETVAVGTLYVPVVRFSSGNLQRDRDVAEILEYTRFPFITVTVRAPVDAIEPLLSGASDSLTLPVVLSLTVRDCTRVFPDLPASLSRRGDTLTARVAIGTRFTELGIQPPRVKGLGFLGGLVSRADDTLHLSGVLHFLPQPEEKP